MVDVSEGGETKNIDIRLGRPASTYSVSGRVIDADTGQPVPRVNFAIGTVQQNQNQSYVGGMGGPGTPTNSQGEFRVEGLSAGHYVVMLNPRNFNPNIGASPQVYSDPVPFEILDSDVSNLEIKAQHGLGISGVVILEGFTEKTLGAKMSDIVIYGRV